MWRVLEFHSFLRQYYNQGHLNVNEPLLEYRLKLTCTNIRTSNCAEDISQATIIRENSKGLNDQGLQQSGWRGTCPGNY